MRLTTIAASLFSAGVATLITGYVMEKAMLKELDERLERELEASVNFLVTTEKAEPTEEYEEHQRVVGKLTSLEKPPLDEIVKKNQKTRYDNVLKGANYVEPEPEVIPDGEIEVCDTLGDIHVISTEEFMANESGFLQSSMTYFSDGGVLDEDGELVVDFEDMIGTKPPFGELSGEPHIVYLRNTKRNQEYEVIFDEARAEDVLAEPGSMP